MRAAEELRSALVFRALRAAGRRSGLQAWPRWDAIVGAAVRDELVHAHLCAEMGRRLGASRPRYDRAPLKARLAPLPQPRQRMLSLLLVEVAMGETVSTALFHAGYRAAREPRTRKTLGAILRDESRHARLGWRALAELCVELDENERAVLAREASRGLAAMENQTAVPALRRLQAGAAFDPALPGLGVLAPEVRVEAFYATVERKVLHRLDQLGLDGLRAWSERHRA